MKVFQKDPDAVKDYTVDWSSFLGADTIVTSTWFVSPASGLTIDSDTNDDTASTVWLSGGTLATKYTVTNRITTAGGRTEDRSLLFQIVQQ